MFETADRFSQEQTEYFVSSGGQRIGPIGYLHVIRALQERSVDTSDLIWREGMSDWSRIGECDDFASDRVRELAASPCAAGVLIQRRFPRREFHGEVLLHDNRQVWTGTSYQGGEGGSGLWLADGDFAPGQIIQAHFGSREGLSAFNALCEVVSKRANDKFAGGTARKRGPRVHEYGVKFLKIDTAAEERVREFFRRAESK